MTTISTPLSTNDSAVLSALFDAESSPSTNSNSNSTTITLDPSLPHLPSIPTTDLQSLQSRELSAIQPLLEQKPTEKTPPATLRTAITKLSDLISENPHYASAYVNRAQAGRMLADLGAYEGEEEKEQGKRDADGDVSVSVSVSPFADLSTAISLLTPPSTTTTTTTTTTTASSSSYSSQHRLSPHHARLLSTAHTHRAYILYKASHSQTQTPTDLPPHLRSKPSQELEELASADFALGGRYGNEVARQMAVRTNPYAKMCGGIVRGAIRGEVEGFVL
ncbi:hypothetical protein FQN50_002312 [Emmonsiellopsis sp. PD_5]|nr:hypothetical protein FQN50_002312 [Emmonsiellopsis sp. PD_5]